MVTGMRRRKYRGAKPARCRLALILSLSAIVLFAAAAVTDLHRLQVPNRLTLALALLGLLRIGIALAEGGGAVASAVDLGAAVGVFVVAALGFRFGLLGGGDVKLLAAGALWLGAEALGTYLVATVLAGGLLAMGFVLWHLVVGRRRAGMTSLPYAVAIAAGGILTTGWG
jgi:prepilin peptidase CpaA